ncbi:MAG: glycosyltransferase family 39 protein [Planctomycetota bacterium]|nr:glycosyltransferase family 39 protein [Planctomycetota bacterium]
MKSETKLLLATIALGLLHVALLGWLADAVPFTPDERGYFLSGRNLSLGRPFEVPEQRFQGPLGLWANQLFVDGARVDPDDLEPVRATARFGMLGFAALLLAVVGLWAHQLYGRRAALLAVFLAATSPTLLAYGPLLAVDVALAATSTLAFFALWHALRRPSWPRVLAFGVATGLLLATKYTSLLLVVAAVCAVGVAVLRGADLMPGRPANRRLLARLGRSVTALVAAGAVALLVLHGCYGFAVPAFDAGGAAGLTSGVFRALCSVPLGHALLGLLPEPFVLGADYQATVSRDFSGTFLDHAGSHWAYYPTSFLTKTPLGTLLLFALALWQRPDPTSARRRFAGICLAAPALVLLVYLSVASSLQMGIRYLLPLLPMLFVRTGGLAATHFARTAIGKLALVAATASCVWAAVGAWPHHIGYFNVAVGGPAHGYRFFADGNCDWLQRFDRGQVLLRERLPDVDIVTPGADPRFGKVAAYALDLKPADPERPGRTYHWLTRFPVVDHDSSAWIVFDASRERFDEAVGAGDPRAAYDLALALLRDGDRDEALRALDSAGDGPRAMALRGIVARDQETVAAGPRDAAARIALVQGLQALGHAELALAFFGEPVPASRLFWFTLMVESGQLGPAVAHLQEHLAEGDHATALLLAQGLFWQAKPEEALAVLEANGPAPSQDPLRSNWQKFEEEVRKAARAVAMLRGPAAEQDR